MSIFRFRFALNGKGLIVSFAVVAYGSNSSGTSQLTAERYTFVSDVVAPLANAASATNGRAGVGDTTAAVMTNTGSTSKFAYASLTWLTGTAMTYKTLLGAVGNSTKGLFAGGRDNGSTTVASTETYTFANNTVAAGGTLTVARTQMAGAGNQTIGVLYGGLNASSAVVGSVDRYTFSNDSVAAGTDLTANYRHAGAGDGTIALFAGGIISSVTVASTLKYTVATALTAAGTSLTQARNRLAAASAKNTAAFFSGTTSTTNSTAVATVDRYTYATDAVAAGSSLAAVRFSQTAVCSQPGHF